METVTSIKRFSRYKDKYTTKTLTKLIIKYHETHKRKLFKSHAHKKYGLPNYRSLIIQMFSTLLEMIIDDLIEGEVFLTPSRKSMMFVGNFPKHKYRKVIGVDRKGEYYADFDFTISKNIKTVKIRINNKDKYIRIPHAKYKYLMKVCNERDYLE